MKKPIIAALLAVFAIYLLFAFTTWKLNPGEWHDAVRFFAAWIAASIGGVILMGAT